MKRPDIIGRIGCDLIQYAASTQIASELGFGKKLALIVWPAERF